MPTTVLDPGPDTVQVGDLQFRPIHPVEALDARARHLARTLNADLAKRPEPLTVVPVLKGALRFLAGFAPWLERDHNLAGARVSIYNGETEPTSTPQWTAKPAQPAIKDHLVLVVEDILDTGTTARYVVDELKAMGAAEVWLVAMFRKPARYQGPTPYWVGYDLPNRFVVGYGLDYRHQGRQLPGLYEKCREANPGQNDTEDA